MSFTLRSETDRAQVAALIPTLKEGTRVEIKQPKRSGDQNAKMWACLADIAEQVKWHGLALAEEDWKLIFLNGLKRELRIVPNLDGTGFVSLGQSSSDLSVSEMSDLIELILMFGANHGVVFKDSNSSGTKQQANGDRPDTPAVSGPPSHEAAGVTHSEVSTLSDDWRDVYITSMSGVRDKAASLKTRNHEAWQMIGGAPNESEKTWMREVWNLVHRRDTGKLKPEQFFAEIAKLKAMPERQAA